MQKIIKFATWIEGFTRYWDLTNGLVFFENGINYAKQDFYLLWHKYRELHKEVIFHKETRQRKNPLNLVSPLLIHYIVVILMYG